MDGWMGAETVIMKADGEINGWMDGWMVDVGKARRTLLYWQ
jgi:hypothetical protein